jgi:hypothetical protein
MNESVIPPCFRRGKLVPAKAGNGNPEGFIFKNSIKNRSILVKNYRCQNSVSLLKIPEAITDQSYLDEANCLAFSAIC